MKESKPGGGEPARFDDVFGHTIYQKLAQSCPTSVGEGEARKFYDQTPQAFTAPASARVARVMLPVAEKIGGVPAMAWLMEQAQAVAKGSTSFEQVAASAEKVYRMETQGDLGWVNLTGDVSVMRAIASAKRGELVGPTRDGEFGYLFLVGDKREERVMKWDEIKNSAENRKISYCRAEANKALTDRLFKQYGVVIDGNAIRALFNIAPRPVPGASAAAR